MNGKPILKAASVAAKILVVMVKNKGAPVSRAAPKETS